MQVEPRLFYEPLTLLEEVKDKVEQANVAQEPIDYLTFVPDGEPTLDKNLGQEIDAVRTLGIPIAIITNSSLLWREEVREWVSQADWVSVKVDSVDPRTWRRVNRPHRSLELERVLEGIRLCAAAFAGQLASERMLVNGLNDTEADAEQVADFLGKLRPSAAYISIPTRPPAEDWAHGPAEDVVNRFYQVVRNRLDNVEYLIGYEGNAFAFTGNVEEDLLSITAVHPMRQDAVDSFLAKAKADWSAVDSLITRDQLIETEHEGRKFYMRKLN